MIFKNQVPKNSSNVLILILNKMKDCELGMSPIDCSLLKLMRHVINCLLFTLCLNLGKISIKVLFWPKPYNFNFEHKDTLTIVHCFTYTQCLLIVLASN